MLLVTGAAMQASQELLHKISLHQESGLSITPLINLHLISRSHHLGLDTIVPRETVRAEVRHCVDISEVGCIRSGDHITVPRCDRPTRGAGRGRTNRKNVLADTRGFYSTCLAVPIFWISLIPSGEQQQMLWILQRIDTRVCVI